MRNVPATRGSVGRASLICVVDDDPDVLESLATLLDVAGYAVVSFVSGDALLKSGAPKDAACVLLDLHLGTGPDGIEVLEELRRRGDGTPVVMVTAHGDVAAAVRAMRAGAADFVEKPYSRDRLLAAVADARARGAFQARAATLLGQLTRREREVLDGLVAGKANKQVAYDMGISPRTVEVHRAAAMVKLQARSFADAVRIVLAQPGVS